MLEIQKIVTSAGWLNQCPGSPPLVNFKKIEPEELSPSQWDAAVQEKRQQVLAEGNKALPAQSSKKIGKDPNQNDVHIVMTFLTTHQIFSFKRLPFALTTILNAQS